MPALPGEADLRRLARAFADAEARVRALVARAPQGNRRGLLTEALRVLVELRRREPREAVFAAYLAAFRGGDVGSVTGLANSLAQKLDKAALTATANARGAFRAVTLDSIEEMATLATTAHIDSGGQRWGLGRYAEMTTATIGRQATSRGTVDAVGDGLVVVEGSSADEICGPLIGETFPASSAPQPPFHVGCECALTPT